MAVLEGDFAALIKVTAWVVTSSTYARLASTSTEPGNLRLLALLPVIILFPCLPWCFNAITLRGASSFFLAWLGVFKLLLLAFGAGPLRPSLPLPTFIAVASLPVKIKIRAEHSKVDDEPSSSHCFFPTCVKLAALALVTPAYRYKSQIHPWIMLSIYCLYIYLNLELLLAFAAFLAGYLLGLGLEPQVNAPYRSTSLQDFWGRRWNLMVTNILRPSVYFPVRSRFGAAAGVVAAFMVSGLMHEVVLYCMTLERPTGEVTLFFLVHGVCTAAEARAKKAGWWRPLHPVVAVPMTIGFVVVTAFWLFLPALLRGGADQKGFEEVAEVLRLAADGGLAVLRLLTGCAENE